MCGRERERESGCVREIVCDRECVCVCERERERVRETVRVCESEGLDQLRDQGSRGGRREPSRGVPCSFPADSVVALQRVTLQRESVAERVRGRNREKEIERVA